MVEQFRVPTLKRWPDLQAKLVASGIDQATWAGANPFVLDGVSQWAQENPVELTPDSPFFRSQRICNPFPKVWAEWLFSFHGAPVEVGSIIKELEPLDYDGWLLHFQCFALWSAPGGRSIGLPLGAASALISTEGFLTKIDLHEAPGLDGHQLAQFVDREFLVECVRTPLVAWGLLADRKKVAVVAHEPTRSQRRRFPDLPDGPAPYVVYAVRTLYTPISSRKKQVGDLLGVGYVLKHKARAHYAYYTAERPMFGWYVGAVHRDSREKGKERFGARAKVYNIQRKKPDERKAKEAKPEKEGPA